MKRIHVLFIYFISLGLLLNTLFPFWMNPQFSYASTVKRDWLQTDLEEVQAELIPTIEEGEQQKTNKSRKTPLPTSAPLKIRQANNIAALTTQLRETHKKWADIDLKFRTMNQNMTEQTKLVNEQKQQIVKYETLLREMIPSLMMEMKKDEMVTLKDWFDILVTYRESTKSWDRYAVAVEEINAYLGNELDQTGVERIRRALEQAEQISEQMANDKVANFDAWLDRVASLRELSTDYVVNLSYINKLTKMMGTDLNDAVIQQIAELKSKQEKIQEQMIVDNIPTIDAWLLKLERNRELIEDAKEIDNTMKALMQITSQDSMDGLIRELQNYIQNEYEMNQFMVNTQNTTVSGALKYATQNIQLVDELTLMKDYRITLKKYLRAKPKFDSRLRQVIANGLNAGTDNKIFRDALIELRSLQSTEIPNLIMYVNAELSRTYNDKLIKVLNGWLTQIKLTDLIEKPNSDAQWNQF